ncbi:MAG: DUF5330 domain-containing protein [Rhizobiaceae bacterium]|nr:DUF5330 domain-containing protein [Rhizobiaceae bacterium]
MFIPITQDDTDLSNQPVSTMETFTAASAIYGDFAQFCDRNPQTCDTGRYFATQFKKKARAGANYVIAYLDDSNADVALDPVTTSSIAK